MPTGVHNSYRGRVCEPSCECVRHSETHRTKARSGAREAWLREDYRVACLPNLKLSHTSEAQVKREKSLTGRTVSETTRRKVSAALMGHSVSLETRSKIGAANVRRWSNPEYVRSLCIGPNKAEQSLQGVLLSFGFTFSGDGTLLVDAKRPDFWNGDRKLIELYGDYWHRDDDPQERIDFFKTRGYDCLVIWEHELKDMKAVTDRVAAFVWGL